MNLAHLTAIMRKESLQILRDPSSILIAFVLPAVLLFLFAYAVSLDLKDVRIAVVDTSDSAAGRSLASAFGATNTFIVTPMRSRQEATQAMIANEQRGVIIIPADVERRLQLLNDPLLAEPLIQVLPDSTQPNTANFIAAYTENIVMQWLAERGVTQTSKIQIEPRVWFNPEVRSALFLVPGAIAIIMTMIGTLLTSMVFVREWERGTMEALLSTPVTLTEILFGKLLPYFLLGLAATTITALLAIFVFGVPLRGSWLTLLCLSAVFLIPALGQGLLISVVAKNQFVAAQMAVFSGFLPSLILSGFLFEIASMPLPLQIISAVIPARYFVASLKTVFLTGDVWALMLPCILAMLLIGTFFFTMARKKMRRSLER
jgi:ABC-2 type transport system permease protein